MNRQFITNELKVEFLNCDSIEKLEIFLYSIDIVCCDSAGKNMLHYYLNNIDSFKLGWNDIIPEILKKGLDINAPQSKGAFKRSHLYFISVFNELLRLIESVFFLKLDFITYNEGVSIEPIFFTVSFIKPYFLC